MYSIGQRVQCISGLWGAATGTSLQKRVCPNLPEVGKIYHIRAMEHLIAVDAEGPAWFVRLREIVNPVADSGVEPVFYARHFVPLHERTCINFAYEILKAPQKVIRRSKEEAGVFKRSKRRERA